MWEKRQRGYQAMGYRIPSAPASYNLNFELVAANEADIVVTEAGMK